MAVQVKNNFKLVAVERTTLQGFLPLKTGKTSHNNTFNEPEHLELKFSGHSKHTNFHTHCFESSSISISSTSLRRCWGCVFQNFSWQPWKASDRILTISGSFISDCSMALQNRSDNFYYKEEYFSPSKYVGFFKVKEK